MLRRKQKEIWWENTGGEQNAASETDAEAVAETAAEEQPPDSVQSGKPQKPKDRRKRRWDWWGAAGDLLEVILDFVTELFD